MRPTARVPRPANPGVLPPFLRNLPVHEFDSTRDGRLSGSSVADIVRAQGNLRTVTAVAPLPQGALVSVAVSGTSFVEVETSADCFIMRFGVGGRLRYESKGQSPGSARDIMLSPGTQFSTFGQDESSLLLALHRCAVQGALGPGCHPPGGILPLARGGGASLRADAFVAARTFEGLPLHTQGKFLRNFQHAMAASLALLLREMRDQPRTPDPMIGRRKVADLCEWAALDRDEPLTIGELAARCGLGLRALEKNFLRHFETTPLVYLRNLRLEKVRRLLQDQAAAWSVTAAALEAGFVHLGRFSAFYRARFGECPSETRNRTLGPPRRHVAA